MASLLGSPISLQVSKRPIKPLPGARRLFAAEIDMDL